MNTYLKRRVSRTVQDSDVEWLLLSKKSNFSKIILNFVCSLPYIKAQFFWKIFPYKIFCKNIERERENKRETEREIWYCLLFDPWVPFRLDHKVIKHFLPSFIAQPKKLIINICWNKKFMPLSDVHVQTRNNWLCEKI